MVKAYMNLDTGAFNFKIGREEFPADSIIAIFQKFYCPYDPTYQVFTQESAVTVKEILTEIAGYTDISISEEDRLLLDDMLFMPDPGFRKLDLPFPSAFMEKHPPIIGKGPDKDYQEKTIRFLISQNRGIGDLPMGSGKTYVMSAVLSCFFDKDPNFKVVWVCRQEGLEGTRDKALMFLKEYLSPEDVVIITKDNREIEDSFSKKLIIIDYNTFKLSHHYYQEKRGKGRAARECKRSRKTYIDFSKFAPPESLAIILDEGQAIKNDSIQTHVFNTYKDFFDYRYVISGSIGYKIFDYFFVTRFLVPYTMSMSFSAFQNFIAEEDLNRDWVIKPEAAKILKERVIDKLKISFDDSCLDLPVFTETIVKFEMTPVMRNYYKGFVKAFVEAQRKKNNGKEATENQVFRHFSFFTSFTSDLSLCNVPDWSITDNPKYLDLVQKLDQFIHKEHRKVIIWSLHPQVINLLADQLKEYQPYVVHGDAKTSVKNKERFSTVQAFRESKDCNLLICSYVLNSSIDIPEATRTIYWDITTDNDKLNQSKKRHHRIGQKENTETYYYLFNNSLDVYIWNNILLPKTRVKGLLSSNKEMTIDTYRQVFNSRF